MNSDLEERERGLLPYSVITKAVQGDPEAMMAVVRHYESYISRLSTRKLRDECGSFYYGIDMDIRDRLRAKLMWAILAFHV